MVARIYKPARTAMQSGHANTKEWVLDYEPSAARTVEPLMGWTSSTDMNSQVKLRFATKEEAIAYCERHGIAYQVSRVSQGAGAPPHGSNAPTTFCLHAPRAMDALTS